MTGKSYIIYDISIRNSVTTVEFRMNNSQKFKGRLSTSTSSYTLWPMTNGLNILPQRFLLGNSKYCSIHNN